MGVTLLKAPHTETPRLGSVVTASVVAASSPGDTGTSGRSVPPGLWLPFLCREQLAVGRCVLAAGAEVQRGLRGAGRLQGQGEILSLVSGDAVTFRDVPFGSAADTTGIIDQTRPLARVLSIPEHCKMVHVLRTFQDRLLSCLYDAVSRRLGDGSIHGACCRGRHKAKARREESPASAEQGKAGHWGLANPGQLTLELTRYEETESHTEEVGAHRQIGVRRGCRSPTP